MDCKNSALCIFDSPGVLTDIKRSYMVDYYPINSLKDNAPIEFVIPSSAEDYIDLSNTTLYVRFKILHDDLFDHLFQPCSP